MVEHVSDLRITAPAAPLQHSCYRIETETHRGAISLEEIEGEAIDGYAFGNVFAQSGETWGYLSGILGQLDGAFLTVEVQSNVEGADNIENEQWAFIEGGIVTATGTYFDADCGPIDAEYIEWVTN
ncbi:hypothetical protein [Cognatiyoonia sp. IB215182]|uniref:hypothetical protein n=1 Tax=Cognatiyoonia sp. IB215182 TaxID=3097353 RepID=UPI002A12B061|nr:hypothetical protein [Cognatiyoonia sp. IB215182]MDX8354306.1 hypothetical protein [Cognatiyoonia sp. IB215182]